MPTRKCYGLRFVVWRSSKWFKFNIVRCLFFSPFSSLSFALFLFIISTCSTLIAVRVYFVCKIQIIDCTSRFYCVSHKLTLSRRFLVMSWYPCKYLVALNMRLNCLRSIYFKMVMQFCHVLLFFFRYQNSCKDLIRVNDQLIYHNKKEQLILG